MTLILLLACSGEPAPAEVVVEASPELPAEPPEPAFDYRGTGIPLVPDMTDFHAVLRDQKVSAAAARHAAEVEYKPDVMVEKIAATRTGAELGALFVEAGSGELPVMLARAQRIRAGLEAINDEGPALQDADSLIAWLKTDPPREELLAGMDTRTAVAIETLAEHAGDELVPLVLAGAWLQAYDLLALAMEETGNRAIGPQLLAQPAVGLYFKSYTASVGQDFIPSGMLGPMTHSLDRLEQATNHDPMSPEDVAAVRDATESLLGMM